MSKLLGALGVAMLACVAGCGLTLDFDPPDPGMDGGIDDGPCVGAVQGTTCGDPSDGLRRICVDGECRGSSCGDGVVDVDGGEQCDDGNGDSGDGCEPTTCRFTCTSDPDCSDGLFCTGEEACVGGRCVDGTAAMGGAVCMLEDGTDGACSAGVCVPPGCGNGVVEAGEACDEGEDRPDDGCEPDCTLTCVEASDCDDADVCTGVETCVEARGCVRPAAMTCTPIDDCHIAATCDGIEECPMVLIDADRDGHAPLRAGCGDDCDDSAPSVYLGAPEQCNARDDDCDGVVDEGTAVEVACFPDRDGDGFGDAALGVLDCSCERLGRTPIGGDCFDDVDAGSEVSPARTAFSARPYCRGDGTCSHDFDCDGVETPAATAIAGTCRGILGGCVGSGWVGSVAACGVTAEWIECGPSLLILCAPRRTTRTQLCR